MRKLYLVPEDFYKGALAGASVDDFADRILGASLGNDGAKKVNYDQYNQRFGGYMKRKKRLDDQPVKVTLDRGTLHNLAEGIEETSDPHFITGPKFEKKPKVENYPSPFEKFSTPTDLFSGLKKSRRAHSASAVKQLLAPETPKTTKEVPKAETVSTGKRTNSVAIIKKEAYDQLKEIIEKDKPAFSIGEDGYARGGGMRGNGTPFLDILNKWRVGTSIEVMYGESSLRKALLANPKTKELFGKLIQDSPMNTRSRKVFQKGKGVVEKTKCKRLKVGKNTKTICQIKNSKPQNYRIKVREWKLV